jgi:16S rRNA processing protein RimM
MTPSWDDLVLVGRVARPHGNRGEIIVNPDTDFVEERFRVGARLFVRQGNDVVARVVTASRVQQGRPVVGLDGLHSIDDAAAIAGAELRVPSDELIPLPPGTYYRHDLVGCRVRTTQGVLIGIVRGVEGARDGGRLVVSGPAGDVLVPLAGPICRSIDPAAQAIVIDPPEGLLELNVPARRASGPPRGRE